MLRSTVVGLSALALAAAAASAQNGACCIPGTCTVTTQSDCPPKAVWMNGQSCGTQPCAPAHFAARWVDNFGQAKAVATFDLTPQFENPGNYPHGLGSIVTNLKVRVYDANDGNGTWSQSDFYDMVFNWPSAINTAEEWYGQPLSNGGTWGTSCSTDFNIFASNISTTPSGSACNVLSTATLPHEDMHLSSFGPDRPTGGCCLQTGACIFASEADCQVASGTYTGSHRPCVTDPCRGYIAMHTTADAICPDTTTFVVTIDVAAPYTVRNIAGGQFFMEWDPRLSLVQADPGPGLNIIYSNSPNPVNFDLAVGIPDGGPTISNQTLATVTFSVNSSELQCDVPYLVRFRSGDIYSRLSDDQANDLNLYPADLGSLPGSLRGPQFPPFWANRLFTTYASPGSCATGVLNVPPVTAIDTCGNEVPVTVSHEGQPITFPAVIPVTGAEDYTLDWTATDLCGRTTTVTNTAQVFNANRVQLDIELDGVHNDAPASRCLRLDWYTDNNCTSFMYSTINVNVVNGRASLLTSIPCGNYYAVTVSDPQHTLRRTAVLGTPNLTIENERYMVNLTSETGKPLISGNFNNDRFIDILDFGGYAGQYGRSFASADSSCDNTRTADFDLNASVGVEDFTFITFNFLKRRDVDPCGNNLVDPEPVADISVADLISQGMRDLAQADYTLDGRLNADDMAWVAQHGLPRCAADINDDQAVNVQDIFAFLNAWFGGHPKTDANLNGQTDVQDIFVFLAAWFAGC